AAPDTSLRAHAAGQAAGGEISGRLISTALRVTGPHDVDLRVDRAAAAPITKLGLKDRYPTDRRRGGWTMQD
ncbi:MAG: hypothetical protein ACI87T_003929, partial [Planctomycetota bacterium]